MFVMKLYINSYEIKEIWVQNKKKIHPDSDLYEYRIMKPEGFEDTPLYHVRSDGAGILAERIMRRLNTYGPQF